MPGNFVTTYVSHRMSHGHILKITFFTVTMTYSFAVTHWQVTVKFLLAAGPAARAPGVPSPGKSSSFKFGGPHSGARASGRRRLAKGLPGPEPVGCQAAAATAGPGHAKLNLKIRGIMA